jgi:excinuclease ABC subunit A
VFEGDGGITYEMHFLPDVYIASDVCKGSRYNRETLEIKFKEKNIADVLNMTVVEGCKFFENIPSVRSKLLTLNKVGLGYIQIGQQATTLSGGEAQRIRLATQIGAGLTGVLYVLDEPSIGLHQRDNDRLLATLRRLRDLGNTLVVVEHDEDTIRAADHVVDIGPGAGVHGGHIVTEVSPC